MAQLANTALFNDANLKAYYKLESGALTTDSKGSFTLTNNNTVGEASGKYGGAADLGATNTNKYLHVANDVGITGGACSYSCWVKLNTEIGSDRWVFVAQQDSGTSVAYWLAYDYNGGTRRIIGSRIRQSISEDIISHNVTLGTTNWNHIVFTYDGTNTRLYFNGTLVAGPTAFSGNGTGSTLDWVAIGADRNTPSGYASAIIDDVAVFNDALSLAEIQTLYVNPDSAVFFATNF